MAQTQHSRWDPVKVISIHQLIPYHHFKRIKQRLVNWISLISGAFHPTPFNLVKYLPPKQTHWYEPIIISCRLFWSTQPKSVGLDFIVHHRRTSRIEFDHWKELACLCYWTSAVVINFFCLFILTFSSVWKLVLRFNALQIASPPPPFSTTSHSKDQGKDGSGGFFLPPHPSRRYPQT